MTIIRSTGIDPEFDRYLNKKIREDNARPLLPELPRPDEDLLRLRPKALIDDVWTPPTEVGDPVLSFNPPYAWLHNDYPCELIAMGYRFRSVSEAFFVAEQNVKPNDDMWDEVTRLTIMRLLVEQKFTQDEGLMYMLLGTKKRHIEFVNETDFFWGTNQNKKQHALLQELEGNFYEGKNELGKMLMEIRGLLKVGMAGHAEVLR